MFFHTLKMPIEYNDRVGLYCARATQGGDPTMQSTRKVKQVLALMAAAVGVYAVLTILGDARPSVTVDGVGRRPADPPSVEPHLLLARQVDRRHLVQRVCALAAADTQSTST